MSIIEKMADRLTRQANVNGYLKEGVQLSRNDMEGGNLEVNSSKRQCDVDIDALEKAGYLTPRAEATKIAEEYRRIKSPLLANAFGAELPRNARANLVMITSALPGEGKSYTAINLAMSLSMELDTRVLLVDGDVARASVTKTFGLEGEPGLMDLLVEMDRELGDTIYSTDTDKLQILPAGQKHTNFTELFASTRMRRITEELSERYPDRIVLFDAPPLLATTQASVLAGLVGQVLFVVEAEKTPQHAIKEALTMLDRKKVIGAVLNKSRQTLGNGYYDNYY